VRFGEAVAAWKAERRAQGLPVPEKPPPPKARADYSRDVGAALPGERLRHKWRDVEDCVAWMVRYLEDVPAGARSTSRSYRDWTLRQDGAPAPDTLIQHGGFERVRRLAQERIRAARWPAHA
jgi:sulfite reductase beta subunit-like hemoprotein